MRVERIISALSILLILAATAFFLFQRRGTDVPSQDPHRRYNVVMIVSDALRRDALGCYGGEARTPNLDRLAERGVIFDNARATSPWTAPSSVSMLTGNYATSYPSAPFNRSVRIFVPDRELLPMEACSLCGYLSFARIENIQAALHNTLQGMRMLPNIGDIEQPGLRSLRTSITSLTGRSRFRTAAYRNNFIVLKCILELPAGRPFILLDWILDPHEPYAPIDQFKKRIALDPSRLSRHKRFYASRSNFHGPLDDYEEEYRRRLYLAEVESVDQRVGYILGALENRGLIDSTYILFTSDHGEQFGEHGLYGHGGFGVTSNFYDVLLRVPLIIAGPDLPAGARIQAPVSHLDLMATLKEMLGLRYRDDMEGESFFRLIRGHASARRRFYFDDVREHEQVDALLRDGFKLISLGETRVKLFHTAADPGETDDLSLSHPALAESLLALLQEQRGRNHRLRTLTAAALEDTATALTEEERERMIEQLRALGYIK